MERVYPIKHEVDEFSPAVEQFIMLLDRLRSEETVRMEHGEVESLVDEDGTEILRRLFQGHLDFRAANEVRAEAVQGADGTVRSHRRQGCERSLETVFGTVKVKRLGYSARGTASLFPMDAALNRKRGKSPGNQGGTSALCLTMSGRKGTRGTPGIPSRLPR